MKNLNQVILLLAVAFLAACGSTEKEISDYQYDESNRRIHQSVEGKGKTVFIYDLQDRLIAEMDESGNTLVEYIYVNGRQVAMANNTNAADEALYYTHTDHLGTPEVMTDTSGEIVWQREQLPFGETVRIEGAVTQNMRFPGQRFHEETGLHYNLNRDYNPEVGRYMQTDPIHMAGGINTFLYANNNPVMYIDPEGKTPVHAAGAIIGGISGGVSSFAVSAAAGNAGWDLVQHTLVGIGTGALVGVVSPFTSPGAGSVASGMVPLVSGSLAKSLLQTSITGAASSTAAQLANITIDPCIKFSPLQVGLSAIPGPIANMNPLGVSQRLVTGGVVAKEATANRLAGMGLGVFGAMRGATQTGLEMVNNPAQANACECQKFWFQ